MPYLKFHLDEERNQKHCFMVYLSMPLLYLFYPGWVAKRPLRKLILQKGVTTFMQNWEETKISEMSNSIGNNKYCLR